MLPEETDVALLERWREGDTSAANRLIRRHFVAVFRYFDANAPASDVEDLTQKTFETCVKTRDKIRDDASFRAFLIGIARNLLYKYMRARGPLPGLVKLSQVELPDSATSPSGFVARVDQREAFLCAVDRLAPDVRDVVILYYWHDMDVGQIAERLGVPPGTIKSRLYRARTLLKEGIARVAADAGLESATLSAIQAKLDE